MQFDLFSDLVLRRLRAQVEAEYGGRSILFERFVLFHQANPHVLKLVLRFAGQLRDQGRDHYGIGAIFERVRWELAITTQEDTGLKLNNNYRAYYARLVALMRPDLADLFSTRALGRHAQVM
jgi:hypothetical protein